MFLHRLNAEQKVAFVELARTLIAADARLSDQEEQMLGLMTQEMGVSVSSDDAVRPVKELCTLFSDRQSRVSVLLELIGLSYADGEFVGEEHGLLRQIAAEFGMGESEMQAATEWVLQQMALATAAAALMEG